MVTDGERMVKASRLYRRASYKWLEKRLGRSYEVWQGQRRLEGRGPQHRGSGPPPSERPRPAPADRSERQISFRAYQILRESTNWGELERGLAAQGLRLQRRGGELVVKARHHQVRASRIYRRGSYGWLERRFGMSFEQWRRSRRELVNMIDQYPQANRESRELRYQRNLAVRQRRDAERLVQHAKEARTASQAQARKVNGILREIYHPKSIRSARRRIAREARHVGWEAAAQRVAKRPGRYGRLARETVRRVAQYKAHRHLLNRLVSAAQDLSVCRADRRKFGPSAYRALQVIPRAQQQSSRAQRRLDRLSPTAMQREIAARALALGVAAVCLTLSPQPSEITRTAVRALKLARSVGRERERGR